MATCNDIPGYTFTGETLPDGRCIFRDNETRELVAFEADVEVDPGEPVSAKPPMSWLGLLSGVVMLGAGVMLDRGSSILGAPPKGNHCVQLVFEYGGTTAIIKCYRDPARARKHADRINQMAKDNAYAFEAEVVPFQKLAG